MKLTKIFIITFTSTLLMLLPNVSAIASDNWDNRVSLLVGQKKLNKGDFEEQHQGAVGILFDLKRKNWPVSIAIDLMASGNENSEAGKKLEDVTGGLHLGMRKYWLLSNDIEPYIGAGINLAIAEQQRLVNGKVETQDDNDTGYWLATGINWKFDSHFMAGIQMRYSEADAKLFDSNLKTGGLYSMFSMSYLF